MQQALAQKQAVAMDDFSGYTSKTVNEPGSWQCYFQADDELFLAPDHSYFSGVSVPQRMDRFGMNVLNVCIDTFSIPEAILKKTRIRVMVRNKRGGSVLNWTSEGFDELDKHFLDTGCPMNVTIPLSHSVLKRIAPGKFNRFYLILEDQEGNMLDTATGEIVFHRYRN